MLESMQHDHATPEPAVPPQPGIAHLAKFPPDDDEGGGLPPGGGVPGGMGGDPGDGDFKKGAIKPIAVIVGLLAVVGLGGLIALGMQQDAKRIPVEEAAEIKKELLILPRAEQLPKWREYASSDASTYLKEEALKQLAWARDPDGVRLAIAGLSDQEVAIQAMAATALAEYGSPMADEAKEPLLQALATAGPETKPQIAWALVELGEARAFDEVMALYRLGHLSKVQKLGGNVAFDPNKIVALVSLDQLAQLAGDESPAVRQLVATVLSRHAEPKWTDALIQLLGDEDEEISRQAAPGLGKIGDPRATAPLVERLKTDDSDSRQKYLEALRDGIGTQGLVLAVDSVDQDDRNRWWHRTKQVFDMIRKLADPRGGDALHAYIQRKPHIHWETMAAFAMAEVGDIRAVPSLARRLRMDAHKIYGDETDYELMLKRNNNERVVAARMIADLAVLHPEEREKIREQSEDAVIFWMHEMPSPHANGMRALAAMESEKELEQLRKWANPDAPLPLEGQQPPFPEEWVIAQSALRYVGWLKDDKSWKVMEKSLQRREKDLDATMDGLMGGGAAILGMTLRALGVGAAQGFAEWGDNKAFKPLLEYIEDPKENEQARLEACRALAWVATDEDMVTVAEKIQEYGSGSKADEIRRACFLETLIMRPIPGTAPPLLALLNGESSMATRRQAARAIGKAGLTSEVEAKLFSLMDDEQLMVDATLALLLGGSSETAARAVAMWADKPKEALEELQELWRDSFGFWSREDLEKGHIFRWVDNAAAIAQVEIRETPQEWARVLLMRHFDNLEYDNGPHSFTRVVLRSRLKQMAEGDDPAQREGAIRTLSFMKEQGVLLALRDAPGETGKLASEAYHELLYPKVVTGVIPEEEKSASRE